MTRIGIGYDIHRLVEGRRLILGGVEIDGPVGLLGHSDADVVIHAVMDALLGAAGLTDIGTLFPPGDEQWRDASSVDLLQRVQENIHKTGFRVGNVDVAIVAEAPKLSPVIPEMRARIAAVLDVQPSEVGIKATTNEGVGPEGRREAISAQAVALLEAIP